MSLTVAYHVPFFHKIKFSYCINMHSSYRIQICTEGVFFMCEGCMELVAIFCTNIVSEKKYRSLCLNTSSCPRLAVNALSFFNLNFIVLCYEHIKSWLCEFSKLFVILWRVYDLKTSTKHYRLHYKSVLRLFWCESER
jgi:hypothetical protein